MKLSVEGKMVAKRCMWHMRRGSERAGTQRTWLSTDAVIIVGIDAAVCFTKSQSITSKTNHTLFLTDLSRASARSVVTAFLI